MSVPTSPEHPVVLVADDETSTLELVCILLQREGFHVLPAADGAEALERSRRYAGPIHLAITDLDMPRLSGAELCSRLEEERPGIKVLVMSGGDLDRVQSGSARLPKPFDPRTLVAVVHTLLGRSVGT